MMHLSSSLQGNSLIAKQNLFSAVETSEFFYGSDIPKECKCSICIKSHGEKKEYKVYKRGGKTARSMNDFDNLI